MNGRGFNQEFSGWSSPSIDMQAVRDGRRARVQDFVVDLGVAHDANAGTALLLELPGTLIYADADPAGGFCSVHIEDSNLGVNSNKFYVEPGFTSRVPFTRLLIENPAQAGKTLRLHIGVDVDITPGTNNQVNIAGTVNVATVPGSVLFDVSFSSVVATSANTPLTILAPGSNLNGVIVQCADFFAGSAATIQSAGIIAKASAPASITDGIVLVGVSNVSYAAGTTNVSGGQLACPVRVPAGLGLYFLTTQAASNNQVNLSCDLL